MGGGGDGFGFVLDSDFATGESFRCKTYGNPVLVDKENGSFRIANVECWGFEGLFGKGNKSSQFQSESSNRNR
jgi:TLD